MIDIRPIIRDYKANVPLHMLEAKYKIPIHKIIEALYIVATNKGITNGC